jgi:glycine dehydrogenase subunit 1
MKTYLSGPDVSLELLPLDVETAGTNLESLKEKIDDKTACVIVQTPNFFGTIEDMIAIEQVVHQTKALLITIADPISLGMLKAPGRYGADIVVGNGQSLGNSPNFGGPGFGFMATKKQFTRQLPGRVAGRTVDKDGNTAYTLTLQTREQHIRREKATSNICTNNALNALASTVYLSVIGPQGLKEIAYNSFQKAHYIAKEIQVLKGFKVPYKNFINEFLMILPEEVSPEELHEKMIEFNILPGIHIGNYFPEIPRGILLSVTETTTMTDIYMFLNILNELSGKVKRENQATL